ncbi:uncharacterized protein LOC106160948 [Lingula anatina]|uniref:Uncharacterized protein LOC106160948 n=1 Tax=Lingula anatina TaxID=7574 RepID=A0A1S3I5U4_LINAN|nr:uncharacterized protein LOC106160948 [Lingula anatina]|eukprot:XP_013393216.1 uncharacterized protein LOC106160948 [Lingula anatina]
MTHGGGSCGGGYSGGGGGFYGGGYWGANSSRRRKNDEDCEKCCSCIFILLGSLLCLTKLTRKQRIAVFWVQIIIITVVTSTVLYSKYNATKKVNVAPTDMRALTKDTTTLLGDGMTLKSHSNFNAYLFKKVPRVVSNATALPYTYDTTLSLQPDRYEYYGYYLLPGSTIEQRACTYFTNSIVTMFVIRGRSNLDKWIKSKNKNDCGNCYIYSHVFETSYGRCSWDEQFNTYTLLVEEADDYYFLFANLYLFDSNFIHAHFRLNRTIYDVTEGLLRSSCNHVTHCHYPLEINSAEVVVIEAPAFYSHDDDMDVTNNARSWLYVVFFLVIPLVLGVSVSSLLFFFCKDPNKPERSTNPQTHRRQGTPGRPTRVTGGAANVAVIQVSDRTPLAPNLPPAYDCIPEIPPVSKEAGMPPTYEQAVQGGLDNVAAYQ